MLKRILLVLVSGFIILINPHITKAQRVYDNPNACPSGTQPSLPEGVHYNPLTGNYKIWKCQDQFGNVSLVPNNLTVSSINNTCIATSGSAVSIQTCINNFPNGGGQIFIPSGTYSSTSCPVLTIGGTSPNIQNGMELYGAGSFGSTIIQYTGSTVCSQVILVQNTIPATNLVFDLVMRDFEVRSSGNAQNGIKLNEVHHSTLQDILCRDVSITCLVWYGGVGNNILHWKTTNSGVTYSTFPQHCMDLSTSLGSSGNGFTSTHIVSPVCEFVTGTGILMSNAQFNVMSGAQISSNGASLDLENGTAGSNSNQFEGNLYEVASGTGDNIIVAAPGNVFVNSALGIATTKFHIKAGGYNNRIENGVIGSVTIDAGVLNTHLVQINTDPANIIDNGTNTQITNPFGVTNHKQWFFTQPTLRQVIPGVQTTDGLIGGAGYDPQDHPVQGCWDIGTSAVVISRTPLTISKPWRALFIGMWENNTNGTGLAQMPEMLEVTSVSSTLAVGSVTLTFSVNASGFFQGISSASNASFCGTIYMQPNPNGTAGTSAAIFKDTIKAGEIDAVNAGSTVDFRGNPGSAFRMGTNLQTYFMDVGSVTFRDGNGVNGGSVTLTGPFISAGTAATLTGTGACATFGANNSGAFAGSSSCTGVTAASTITITFSVAATHGYNCNVQDETTRANLLQQTGHTTTTCTLTATSVTQNDIFTFTGTGF